MKQPNKFLTCTKDFILKPNTEPLECSCSGQGRGETVLKAPQFQALKTSLYPVNSATHSDQISK